MSLRMESVWCLNPIASHTHASISMLVNAHSLFTPRAPTPTPTSTRFLTLHLTTTSFLPAFAAPHHDSKHGDIEVQNEKESDDPNRIGTEEESREAWKQVLDTLREQALKIQGVSEEAYELYSKKAVIILKDTAQQLSVLAKEISEESREYIATAAENSPELNDIVETFTSPNEISQLRDFSVGIPYGFVLCLGGFVSFMITGSIAAIRFGMVLGGILWALSVSSLRSYKRGEPSPLTLKGQAAIAGILFLREIRLLAEGSPPVTFFTALISGAVVAFYLYRLVLERKLQYESNLETGEEN